MIRPLTSPKSQVSVESSSSSSSSSPSSGGGSGSIGSSWSNGRSHFLRDRQGSAGSLETLKSGNGSSEDRDDDNNGDYDNKNNNSNGDNDGNYYRNYRPLVETNPPLRLMSSSGRQRRIKGQQNKKKINRSRAATTATTTTKLTNLWCLSSPSKSLTCTVAAAATTTTTTTTTAKHKEVRNDMRKVFIIFLTFVIFVAMEVIIVDMLYLGPDGRLSVNQNHDNKNNHHRHHHHNNDELVHAKVFVSDLVEETVNRYYNSHSIYKHRQGYIRGILDRMTFEKVHTF